jgi:hypothetical protein
VQRADGGGTVIGMRNKYLLGVLLAAAALAMYVSVFFRFS